MDEIERGRGATKPGAGQSLGLSPTETILHKGVGQIQGCPREKLPNPAQPAVRRWTTLSAETWETLHFRSEDHAILWKPRGSRLGQFQNRRRYRRFFFRQTKSKQFFPALRFNGL